MNHAVLRPPELGGRVRAAEVGFADVTKREYSVPIVDETRGDYRVVADAGGDHLFIL